MDFVEGKGNGGWAKERAEESRDRETPLQTKKKGYEGRNGPQAWQQKAISLTSHFATMDFMIEPAGWMVPWELFG